MRVALSAASPFHLFDAAKALHVRGHLQNLYTAYPKSRASGVPRERVISYPWIMAPTVLAGRLGMSTASRRLQRWTTVTYDARVAGDLRPCDVFHSMSSFALHSGRIAKRRYGAVTVCDRASAHILTQQELLEDEHSRWTTGFQRFDEEVVARELEEYECSDRIVVPSDFARDTFISRGVPPAKVVRVPFGVDLSAFRPRPKQDSRFRILFVGAVSLQKGVLYLLEAVKRCHAKSWMKVWLVGPIDDEMHGLLKPYQDLFVHQGVIGRRHLPWYYSQASVFVLPSIQEGMALVQAQALACGVPIIGTVHSGAADLITPGREGFVVPIRDADAITTCLLMLYEQPTLRQAMASSALRRVAELGGWDTYADAMCSNYRAWLN